MVALLETDGKPRPEKTQAGVLWQALINAEIGDSTMTELVIAGTRVRNDKGGHSDPSRGHTDRGGGLGDRGGQRGPLPGRAYALRLGRGPAPSAACGTLEACSTSGHIWLSKRTSCDRR